MSNRLNGQVVHTDYARGVWAYGGLTPAWGIPPLRADYVEVHHEGAGSIPANTTEVFSRLRSIYRGHRNGKGWRDIFYNVAVTPEGETIELRNGVSETSTRKALVVLVLGDRSTSGLTIGEAVAISRLRDLSGRDLRWHRQRAKTACPGDLTVQHIHRINAAAVSPVIDMPEVTPPRTPVFFGPYRPTLYEGIGVYYWPLVRALHSFLNIPSIEWGFGPKTKAAVQTFQHFFGLVPDGIVGPATWAKIDELNVRR